MPSYTRAHNPSVRWIYCADESCNEYFLPTEDIRQKYCSKTCSKRSKNRRKELHQNRTFEFLFGLPFDTPIQRSNVMHTVQNAMIQEGCSTPMTNPVQKNTPTKRSNVMHNESAAFQEGYSAGTTTPVRKNTALVNLEESLVWHQRTLENGISELERMMNEVGRQAKANTETLRKIEDVRAAIALIKRNI